MLPSLVRFGIHIWNPFGIHLESIWNPRGEEKKLKENKLKELKAEDAEGFVLQRAQTAREGWRWELTDPALFLKMRYIKIVDFFVRFDIIY